MTADQTPSAVEPVVLAIDDEAGILKLVKLALGAQGFRVLTAGDSSSALELIEEHRPDIILLDIVMPDIGGMELMRTIRERSNVPIIFLTARDREADKVLGLESGADDYLAKPFSGDELAARIRAVLRRSSGAPISERVVMVGQVKIDLEKRLVWRDDEPVQLSRTEWLLLQQLAANAGKVMLATELLSRVWGPEYIDDVQYLRVWVSRLRHKLDQDEGDSIIRTLPGIGYVLEGEAV